MNVQSEPKSTLNSNEIGLLLEQYKLYVEMADRISVRRGETNKFYISLMTIFVALLSIFIQDNTILDAQGAIPIFSTLGISLCFVWVISIRSYRQINSAKFKVINEIEKFLPYQCYQREWGLLTNNKSTVGYMQLTYVEIIIPIMLISLFLFMLLRSLFW